MRVATRYRGECRMRAKNIVFCGSVLCVAWLSLAIAAPRASEENPLSAALLLPLRSQPRAQEFIGLLRQQARRGVRSMHARGDLLVRAIAPWKKCRPDPRGNRARGMAASRYDEIPDACGGQVTASRGGSQLKSGLVNLSCERTV